MKKANISVSFEEEKLSALKLYLGQKGSSVESELAAACEVLYMKTVPSNVSNPATYASNSTALHVATNQLLNALILKSTWTATRGKTNTKKHKPNVFILCFLIHSHNFLITLPHTFTSNNVLMQTTLGCVRYPRQWHSRLVQGTAECR